MAKARRVFSRYSFRTDSFGCKEYEDFPFAIQEDKTTRASASRSRQCQMSSIKNSAQSLPNLSSKSNKKARHHVQNILVKCICNLLRGTGKPRRGLVAIEKREGSRVDSAQQSECDEAFSLARCGCKSSLATTMLHRQTHFQWEFNGARHEVEKCLAARSGDVRQLRGRTERRVAFSGRHLRPGASQFSLSPFTLPSNSPHFCTFLIRS